MEVMTLAHFQRSPHFPHPSCPQLISSSCVSCFNEWCQHLCSCPNQQLGRSRFPPHLHKQSITKSCKFPPLGNPLLKLDTLFLSTVLVPSFKAQPVAWAWAAVSQVALLPNSCCATLIRLCLPISYFWPLCTLLFSLPGQLFGT